MFLNVWFFEGHVAQNWTLECLAFFTIIKKSDCGRRVHQTAVAAILSDINVAWESLVVRGVERGSQGGSWPPKFLEQSNEVRFKQRHNQGLR